MDKKALRAYGRDIRANISDEQRLNDAVQLKHNVIVGLVPTILERHMQDYPSKSGNDSIGKVIGTYYPHGHEIHPPHGIEGYQMALPVIRNETTLEFYEWAEGEDVVKRDFDIPIPDTRGKMPVTPDILLMPLVLCDKSGNRIGQGAGHYDRYIASLNRKPLLVGVCFDEQVYAGGIPAEPYDVRLDLIITPKRVIEIS